MDVPSNPKQPPQVGTDPKLQVVTAQLKPSGMPRVGGDMPFLRGSSSTREASIISTNHAASISTNHAPIISTNHAPIRGSSDNNGNMTASAADDGWNKYYQDLLRIRNDNKVNQCIELVPDLQNWVTQQRVSYMELMKTGNSSVLTPLRVRLLQGIGFKFHVAVATKPPPTQRRPRRGAIPRAVLEKQQAAAPTQQAAAAAAVQGGNYAAINPWIKSLFEIITNEKDFGTIISWLSHGRGFIIHDKDEFQEKVLNPHFNGCQYKSFTRNLDRWNFERMPNGKVITYVNIYYIEGMFYLN